MGVTEGVSQVLNNVFAKLKADNYRIAILLGIGLIAVVVTAWVLVRQPKKEVKS